jgi:hypothetical protein
LPAARRAGYEVHAVPTPASAFRMSEEAALHRMSQEGVVLTSASTLIGELAYDWQTPAGAELRQVLAQTFPGTIGEFSLTS